MKGVSELETPTNMDQQRLVIMQPSTIAYTDIPLSSLFKMGQLLRGARTKIAACTKNQAYTF